MSVISRKITRNEFSKMGNYLSKLILDPRCGGHRRSILLEGGVGKSFLVEYLVMYVDAVVIIIRRHFIFTTDNLYTYFIIRPHQRYFISMKNGVNAIFLWNESSYCSTHQLYSRNFRWIDGKFPKLRTMFYYFWFYFTLYNNIKLKLNYFSFPYINLHLILEMMLMVQYNNYTNNILWMFCVNPKNQPTAYYHQEIIYITEDVYILKVLLNFGWQF